MPIAIYARKSTEQEDRQVQSLEDQIRELKLLAEREGLCVSEVFQEARSAKEPFVRPEFDRLLSEVREGRIDGVLTWSINRLSRNELDHGQIGHLLRSEKLDFIRTIDRVYRPEDNALLLAIEAGMSVAQLQELRKNVKRGIKGKYERGWLPNKAPVGYLNDADTRETIPDPIRFRLVRRAWDLMLTGAMSTKDIHHELVALGLTVHSKQRKRGPISLAALHGVFKSRFYLGELFHRGERYAGRHQPMVSEDEFLATQEIIRERNRGSKNHRRRFAFSSALRCARCGCSIVGEQHVKQYRKTNRTVTYTYYRCSGARGCSKAGIREEKLVGLVEPVITRMQVTRQTADWLLRTLTDSVERDACVTAKDMASFEESRLRSEKRLRELTLMRLDGELSKGEFEGIRVDLQNEMAAVRNHATNARKTASSLLRLVYDRLDVAVRIGDLSGQDRDPRALGSILQLSDGHRLNLPEQQFYLDPVLATIAAFEPPNDRSDKPKFGASLRPDSVWYTLVSELRRAATDHIERNE